MPNILDANGLQVASVAEITAALTSAFQSIYGSDINVNSNSPDGQLIGILAQNIQDVLEILLQVYNSFNIDSAFGTTLDARVAMSGVQRKQGTFTQAQVNVVVSQALSLTGLDAVIANPNLTAFTVSDDAGNQFQLVTTHAFGGAGNATLTFQSAVIGQIQTTQNTIQTIVTSQLGVTSVNNPSTAGDIQGLPEETDPQLKIRRASSFSLQAIGPADALRAALLNDADISDAYVVENDTNGTVNGVTAHSIWVIVTGGTGPEIGQVIYAKKSPGCGMVGAQSQIIARPQGNSFTAQWDYSLTQALTIRATLTPKIPGQTFDLAGDAIKLANALIYKLGQSPNIGDVVVAMQAIEPEAILSVVNVSKDGGATWQNIVSPDTAQKYFTVSSANITLS
jgi:uncharacterized phage protein gp47/JayE